jgi:hypothetical protein
MDTVIADEVTAGGTTRSGGLELSRKSPRPNSAELPLRDYLGRSTPDRFISPWTPENLGHRTRVIPTDRRKQPLLDPADDRHPFGAYLTITPGDPVELAAAVCLFGSVDVGLQIPDFAIQQFETGQPWSPREPYQQPNIIGSHDVTVRGCSYGMFELLTWGERYLMDDAFYSRFCEDAKVYLSQKFLRTGKFPEGFNTTLCHLDIKALMRT